SVRGSAKFAEPYMFFILSVEKRESLRLAIFLKTSLSILMNTIPSHHRIRKRNCRVNETLFK
ncbi:hypothetical protein, partial [Enterococcus diestrammenae]|uniref:hypothetical protein n=1 Tax=Enterococcus diestrammenae TaxID=1155073 RepID=UPI0022E0470E